jgi:Sap, sulfolipid-1-addressing protein
VNEALSLFLQVLPLALGAAMSPTFLAMQVVVLTSPAPGALRRGWALAAGSMSMLLLISFGGVSLLSAVPVLHTDGPTWAQAVIMAAAGVALLLVARRVQRQPRAHKDSILEKLVDAKPPFIFAAGAARLAVNASTLALYIPALHVITSSTVDDIVKGLAFLMLFLITELAVLGPVVAVTVAGENAKPVLTRIHDRLDQYSKPAAVLTSAGFGVVLLGLAAWTLFQLV